MTIYFGPITSTNITGDANGRFRLGGFASGDALDYDAGVADLHAFMAMEAFGYLGSGGGTPAIPGVARGQFVLGVQASGTLSIYGDADMAPMRLSMQAFNGTGDYTNEGFMTSGFTLSMYAEEQAGAENYGFMVDRIPVVLGLSGLEYLFIDDGVDLLQDQRGRPSYGLAATMDIASSGDDTLAALAVVSSRMELGDRLQLIARELIAEGFDFTASTAAQRTAIERVIDGLMLAGVTTSQLEAVNAVVAAVAFADIARWQDVMEATDGFDMAGAVAQSVAMAARLVETLLADADGEAVVTFVALLGEEVVLGAGADAAATLIAALQEGVNFALHLRIEDGTYSAYVINTESKGTTQYAHYPFNSFALLGDRYYGMTPDGIRELEGKTDAGSPIAARFRMAMTNLGTGHMKRMLAAYLGYTSSGELRLKTITVDKDGIKSANWYRLLAQPASEPREARIKVGQGLRSVYWGFEIEAINGAEFTIDTLNLLPIVVEGRIQGQGGGKR